MGTQDPKAGLKLLTPGNAGGHEGAHEKRREEKRRDETRRGEAMRGEDWEGMGRGYDITGEEDYEDDEEDDDVEEAADGMIERYARGETI